MGTVPIGENDRWSQEARPEKRHEMSKYDVMSLDKALVDEARELSPKSTKAGAVKIALRIGLDMLRDKGSVEDRLERIEAELNL